MRQRSNHFDASGHGRMVDITQKRSTQRVATATARVYMRPETLRRIQRKGLAKGDVLAISQVAGVMGAKRVPDLIPLCHPINLSGVEMSFKEDPVPDEQNRCSISIEATVRTVGRTGVEMEAMTAVSVAALTIYDMCKSVDRELTFGEIMLLAKAGGKSGSFRKKTGRKSKGHG